MNARSAAHPPTFAKSVFINCPFDREYQTLLRPVLFTVLSLGFAPRIATERSDSAESRIGKICEIIRESQFSIHDLSSKGETCGFYYFHFQKFTSQASR